MIELFDYLAVAEVEGGQEVDTVVETGTPTEGQEAEGQVAETEAPEVPIEYDIDGEKYSLDDIREWRKSGLRQSDYTKKSQEVAKLRKENQEALELYNYLMSNQELVKKLVELDTENPLEAKKAQEKLDPTLKRVQELETQLRMKDIDRELSDITSKDKVVTEVELLEIATQLNCNVQTAYETWKGRNADKILKAKEIELKKTIKEQIQKNYGTTKTMIGGADSKNDNGNFGLSDMEVVMAEKLGMSKEEYSKYRNPSYRGGLW